MSGRRTRPSGVSRAIVTLVVSLVIAAIAPRGAMAQKLRGTAATAAALKRQGDHAMDELHYDEALAAYKKSYELGHDAALLYNEARTYQALGDFVSALDLLEQFRTEASPALQARVPDLRGLEAELRGKVTILTLICNGDGAEVVLRDKVMGTTPVASIRTTSGPATLVIHGDKYQEYRKDLNLPGGQPLTVQVTLVPRDLRAVLVVRSEVVGAHVAVDGVAHGDVPLELFTIAGTHAIRLERSGYESAETSAVLGAGERKELNLSLVKKPSIFARWWFWTAVGVAVAGGVTTYVLLSTEKSPDRGSINPGVISSSGSIIRF